MRTHLLVAGTLLLCIVLGACNASEKKIKQVEAAEPQCFAPVEWFSGSVPEPDPQNFPQDPTNCDFHQISWQYFLWLTELVDSTPRFMSFYTDRAIHPKTQNDTNHVLDIVDQAESLGVLVDQNGRAVYGNISINQTYRDWVLRNKLYHPDSLRAFSDTANFPVGSVSLKASWKIVAPNEDVSKLYTRKADIQLLALVEGTPAIPDTPKVQKDVDVALIGLHIAVVVRGHPEFVWATFEYAGNAPDFKPNQGMHDSVSAKNWLLYEAGTTAGATNANNAGVLSFADEAQQTLTPVTQVARQFVNGGGKASNQNNIVQLNQSVQSQLPAGSLWKNYFEVGAEWFNADIGTLRPNWNPNVDSSMVTGSVFLSNSTIETFTQKVTSKNQCFSCHNTMALVTSTSLPGKNANTSHILLKNYQGGGEVKR